MFAAGHIVRRSRFRTNALPDALFLRPRKKKDTKFRCYVPFMWAPLVASCAGLFIILIGIAMCVIGFHARDIVRQTVTSSVTTGVDPTPVSEPDVVSERHNVTRMSSTSFSLDSIEDGMEDMQRRRVVGLVGYAESEEDEDIVEMRRNTVYSQLRSMVYIGPIIMGVGCFACVFSCVAVCETRDKAMEIMDANERSGLSPHCDLVIDFYELVLKPRYHRTSSVLTSRALASRPLDDISVSDANADNSSDSRGESIADHTPRIVVDGDQATLDGTNDGEHNVPKPEVDETPSDVVNEAEVNRNCIPVIVTHQPPRFPAEVIRRHSTCNSNKLQDLRTLSITAEEQRNDGRDKGSEKDSLNYCRPIADVRQTSIKDGRWRNCLSVFARIPVGVVGRHSAVSTSVVAQSDATDDGGMSTTNSCPNLITVYNDPV